MSSVKYTLEFKPNTELPERGQRCLIISSLGVDIGDFYLEAPGCYESHFDLGEDSIMLRQVDAWAKIPYEEECDYINRAINNKEV